MLPLQLPSGRQTQRYAVRSSDVISDSRVNVYDEGSERVVWYKERFLGDDEIIENICDNATSAIHWTIHRPKRGWYLRLRARGAPETSYIALQPLPKDTPGFVDGALQFTLLLHGASSSIGRSRQAVAEGSSSPGVHSYPPTPTATEPTYPIPPPSPRAVNARLAQLNVPFNPPKPVNFILTPTEDEVPPTAGFFARALGVIKKNTRGPSWSFALRVASDSSTAPLSPPASAASAGPSPTSADALGGWTTSSQVGKTLLEYKDTTGPVSFAANSGVLEVDAGATRKLGMPVALAVAIALAYLEFLGEREGYLAASSD